MGDNLESLFRQAQSGDMGAFAQFLSAIERSGPAALRLPDLINPGHQAYRVGITGPPGAGKSTLIGGLLTKWSATTLKIGVIAVDPTSPFSQGAILGDRIRYSDHALNPNIFIRSLGTRGSLGGLSAAVYLMVRAFDACGFDMVLIETVGVGQVEVEVMNVADFVTVVLVPESGDSIQAMKAGVIEIADLFVVNKCDRPGAEALKREIEAAVALAKDSRVSGSRGGRVQALKEIKVLMASATQGEGLEGVADEIFSARHALDLRGHRADPYRLREEAKALMRAGLEAEATARVRGVNSADDLARLFK